MGAAASVSTRDELEQMNVNQVAELVTGIGAAFRQYSTRVFENGIDGQVLMCLDDNDLRFDLNIQSNLHRKTLMVSLCTFTCSI
jgi:hypothetical protein